MYRNYQDYSIEEITENEDLFGMINIPYKMHGENEVIRTRKFLACSLID